MSQALSSTELQHPIYEVTRNYLLKYLLEIFYRTMSSSDIFVELFAKINSKIFAMYKVLIEIYQCSFEIVVCLFECLHNLAYL